MREKKLYNHINQYFKNVKIAPMQGGASGASVFDFSSDDIAEGVLKVDVYQNTEGSLAVESNLLKWLYPNILVPKVHHFERITIEENKMMDVFIMSKLKGKNLKIWRHEWDKKEVAEVYGKALKKLHLLPVDTCPVNVSLDSKLEEAAVMAMTGRVNINHLEDQFRGIPLETLLKELNETKPLTSDFVCAHGDYCLDNIMADVKEGNTLEVTGLIDMGRGGVQDRYQDLALAIRSVRKHLGEAYEAAFLGAYDLIDTLDKEKVHYYILLDEFF